MTIEQFRKLDVALRAERPKPFLLMPSDPPAGAEAIEEVEKLIGATLPGTYKSFLSEFGGGNFGLITVCSADRMSDFYLPKKQAEIAKYAPAGLLVVSDDFAGGIYVLRVADGVAAEAVLYWNDDGGLVQTPFANVLEFIARFAYQPA